MPQASLAIASTPLALLKLRCPRCHTGNLFAGPALSARFMDMPDACPVCRQTYEPEPGFYYGAMYISSGFSTAILLAIGFLLYYLADDPPLWVYITAVGAVVLAVTPLLFRYSRALMLYAFGGTSFDTRFLSH
ncbi:DUF983 domain-containing protein [Hymenobacter sp. 5317J-9]|uniref:DUF983 domain-containing protein n=1 Tax=Hymenobacter sp. 5317J-9 TaxID=2932250 RepID=UPI001FD67317|nr:DUF983 domain-containing protein [Hymenobacter sp. 5317J-9]UOQ99269.1 DUF983 domain-containing protein [Hymenobacter sp. 5317J-9]